MRLSDEQIEEFYAEWAGDVPATPQPDAVLRALCDMAKEANAAKSFAGMPPKARRIGPVPGYLGELVAAEGYDHLRAFAEGMAADAKQLKLSNEAVIAMAEDGWLYFGPEGMSDAQEKCLAAYIELKPEGASKDYNYEHRNAARSQGAEGGK